MMGVLVLRSAANKHSRSSMEPSHEAAAALKVTAARMVLSRSARKQSELTAKGMPRDCDAVGIDSMQAFQKRQTCRDIVKMIRCQQATQQTLSSFFSLRRLLMPHEVLHALTLVCGRALTAAEEIEEGV